MIWWAIETTVIVAVAIAAISGFARCLRPRPAMFHALWLLVFLKFFVPPLVHVPLRVSEGGTRPFTAFSPKPDVADRSDMEKSTTREEPASAVVAPPARVPSMEGSSGISWSWREWLLMIWAAGGLLVGAHQARCLARIAKLRRGERAVPEWLQHEAVQIAGKIGVRSPRITLVRGIDAPFLIGFMRPRLFWPDESLALRDRMRIRVVLAHELAHLRRRDHLLALLETAGGVLWWWNPLYWWVRERMRQHAELAADDWATWAAPESRRAFVETLIDLAERGSRRRVAPAVGVIHPGRKSFERRLKMILKADERRSHRLGSATRLALALGGLILVPGFTPAAGSPRADVAPQDEHYWVREFDQELQMSSETGAIDAEIVTGKLEIVSSQDQRSRLLVKVKVDRRKVEDEGLVGWNLADHLRTSQDGGKLVLREEGTDDLVGKNRQTEVRLELPRPLAVRARVITGALAVGYATGRLQLDVTTGKLELDAESADEVVAKVSTGSIKLSVPEVRGEVRSEVGTGSIAARLGRVGQETTLNVGTGSVALSVPPEISGRFELKSELGGVKASPEFEGNVQRRDLGAELIATRGSGGTTFKLLAGTGSCKLTADGEAKPRDR